MSSKFRSVQLLRVVAAVGVVVTHALFYVRERLDPSVPDLFGSGARVWMFFAISGFVTTLVLRRNPDRSPLQFGLARLVRLGPLYWLMTSIKLAFLLISPALLVTSNWDWVAILKSYAFIPTFDGDGAVHPLWGVGWTLYFEVAFGLLVVAALILRLDPIKFASISFVALACASLLVPEEAPAWTTYATPNVLVFVIGMTVGRMVVDRRATAGWIRLTAISALYVVLTAANTPTDVVRQSLTFVGVAALFTGAIAAERWIAPRIPVWLTKLADSSYSLYLTHPLIAPMVPAAFAILGLAGGLWTWLCLALTVTVPIAAAPLVHRFVERPLTRLAQRAVPRPPVAGSGARHEGIDAVAQLSARPQPSGRQRTASTSRSMTRGITPGRSAQPASAGAPPRPPRRAATPR